MTKRRNSLHKASSGAINGPISRERDSKVVVGSSRVGEQGYTMEIHSVVHKLRSDHVPQKFRMQDVCTERKLARLQGYPECHRFKTVHVAPRGSN